MDHMKNYYAKETMQMKQAFNKKRMQLNTNNNALTRKMNLETHLTQKAVRKVVHI